MPSIYYQISCLSLREIAFPGSNDAGMSALDEISGAAAPWNKLTQTIDISKQFQYGSRYFDIRPVRSGGTYKTGHYGFGLGAYAVRGPRDLQPHTFRLAQQVLGRRQSESYDG